jgi:O-antigen/teichoic acid export membrane protein
LNDAPPVRRSALAIFVGALVGVPAILLVSLAIQLTDQSSNEILGVLLPAALGAAAGCLVIAMRQLRTARPRKADGSEAIGSAIIVGAALIATFSDLLPRSLDAFLSGLVIGFFVALNVFLVRLWRNDPDFRRRIRSIRDGGST